MKSLEVIVRANITVKSSIKNLLLRDASAVVSHRAGKAGGGGGEEAPPHSLQLFPSDTLILRSR